MKDPALSILIVNWNARAFLQQCLASLPHAELPLDVWVVDNDSSDGSAEMVRAEFPRVNLIASDKNLGFAAGNNLAARRARGRYFLLLNPDTQVPRGTLTELIRFAEEYTEAGAVGPELRNADGSHQRSCWRGEPGLKMALADALYVWQIPFLASVIGAEYRVDELRAARAVDHLLGACMLIRRDAWAQVGALDEGYFLFLEETDWCVRARRAGWKIFYAPQVSVTHFGQESMRREPSRNLPHYYRSYLKFYRAHHHTPFGARILKMIIALGCAIRIALWEVRAWRAQTDHRRMLAREMGQGYRQVLRELSTF